MQLFFESNTEQHKLDGKLRYVQQRAKVTEQPVLMPSNAGDGAGTSIYGSVFYDGGKYRMWYQGWPKDWTGKNSAIVCYAESDDGIEWKKPKLKLDERFEGNHNVTDLGMHAPSVFIDPDAPASHRYRATGHTADNNVGYNRGIARTGYFTAHSADGLHWELDSPEPTWDGSDVITSIYHPTQKRAMVALKQNVRSSGIRRRCVAHAYMEDGSYGPWRWSMVPDKFDDITANMHNFASADYYGMGMQPAGSGTVGFVWQFRHSQPRTTSSFGDGQGVFGVVDVSLAYQHDAHSLWMQARGQPDFINHMDIPWRNDGCIYTASAPVTVGDEDRLYLCAGPPHGWYIDPKWQIYEDIKAKLIKRGFAHIGYASWPTNRLFGYRAEPVGSIHLNLGVLDKPVKLHLNYECHNAEGSVTTQVEFRDQLTHGTCNPLTGEGMKSTVTWKNGYEIPPNPTTGAPTVVIIKATEATLWAWETEPA